MPAEAKRFRERRNTLPGATSPLLGATSPLLGATSPLLGATSPLLGADAVRLLGASDPPRGPGTGEGKSGVGNVQGGFCFGRERSRK